MSRLLKDLVSVWVLLAIAVAPLQAFGAATPPSGGDPCGAHAAATQQHAGGHAGKPADRACPHCSQHDCDQNDCSAGSCCAPHLSPAMLFATPAQPRAVAAAADPLPAGDVLSRSDPPPLRPPV